MLRSAPFVGDHRKSRSAIIESRGLGSVFLAVVRLAVSPAEGFGGGFGGGGGEGLVFA